MRILCLLLATVALGQEIVYERAGNAADVVTPTRPGAVLMGGGKDVEDAFRWMIERSGGGDFLVLRAAGTPAYNAFVMRLGGVNSAATMILKERSSSSDPMVLDRIREAEAIWLAGGDQANYIRLWKDTPLAAAIQERIRAGVPVGGTSAGLAVLGEFYFGAEEGTITSAQALRDPFDKRISVGRGFLDVPGLKGILTDSHFAQRSRMGRLAAMLARTRGARGIGIDEATALLLDEQGKGTVTGRGRVWLLWPTARKPGRPLNIKKVGLRTLTQGQSVAMANWGKPPEHASIENGEWVPPGVSVARNIGGFAALWDFVKNDSLTSRFDAWKPSTEKADLRLDVRNYVLDYWGEGREASYKDVPVVDAGPFGKAVVIQQETDPTFRPVLLVPRERMHGSGIDVKGPGGSVTLVAWVEWESGNHAIAGIWHEGTDLKERGGEAKRVEAGRRQYALFAGLAANPRGAASHVSENGASSFGDKYARNLSVTKAVLRKNKWSCVALVFDNKRNLVRSYLDGNGEDFWIEDPGKHPFFQWPAKAWDQGTYRPPAEYLKVEAGKLKALKVNPYWFPHDLYTPNGASQGGPFTIGRVIHGSRGVGYTGKIGGVAVYRRALTAKEIQRLSALTPR
jgi:cyanophycinase